MNEHVKGPGQLSQQPSAGGGALGLPLPSPDVGANANARRLLAAGFMAILASGVGFSVRAGVLGLWGNDYGFTQTELGGITGGGLTGFGIIIILGSLIADRIGYGKLMGLAFFLHVLSAVMQLGTGYVFSAFGGSQGNGKDAAYWNLFIAMFLFSVANGVCEVVVNPMTATLFPRQKTHYLNILHAGWPGGLVAGGLLSYLMNGGKIGTWAPLGSTPIDWRIQMSMFLIPVVVYGVMLLGQRIPRSEAAEAGVKSSTMFAAIATPVFVVLLLAHALVGYVELGTDSWIAKITGAIMLVKTYGLLLFVYTSLLMFALRFFAGPIVEKISPLGLLFVSGILGCTGLLLLGNAGVGAIWFCVLAATVYAVGKTFLWPTMLAVASERFPKGAIAIGALGGAGMLSAGLFGGPGIGFKQDYFATEKLNNPALVTSAPADSAEAKEKVIESKAAYERYKAEKKNTFLFAFSVQGLDGSKTGILDLATTPKESDDYKFNEQELDRRLKDEKLNTWWTKYEIPEKIPSEYNQPPKEMADKDKGPINTAGLYGGQKALQWTAIVPAIMALLYLLLIGYFFMRGGYKAVGVHEQHEGVTPMNRGPAGTLALNEALQAALNPNGASLVRGKATFRVGDKVMQLRNNYDRNVWNGDVGIVVSLDVEDESMIVRFDEEREVAYDGASLDELTLAYACTIHKSQGSEYPAVVIPLLTSHFVMLSKNLVYTAVTRGKKLVVMVADPRAMKLALSPRSEQQEERLTKLAERVRRACPASAGE